LQGAAAIGAFLTAVIVFVTPGYGVSGEDSRGRVSITRRPRCLQPSAK